MEVVDYGNMGGQEIIMLADQVDYDQDLNSFHATGRARVKDHDVLIESPVFDYNKQEDVFRTDQGVVFSSGRLMAESRSMIYRRLAQTLEFEGNLVIEVRAKMGKGLPLSVFGDKFLYARIPKIGRVDGNVRMSQGKSRGTTDALAFRLTPDEQEANSLVLQGAAKIMFFKDIAKNANDPGHVVEADEIRLVPFPDESKVSRLSATGACTMTLSVLAGATDKVRGRLVGLVFDRSGELTAFSASGEARVDFADRGGGDERTVWGDRITYQKRTACSRRLGPSIIRPG